MNWFWSQNPVEKRVLAESAGAFVALGMPSVDASEVASGIVRKAKQALSRVGHRGILDEGLGDKYFQHIDRLPQFAEHVRGLATHGVTERDIREWHNLSELERKVLLETDTLVLLAFVEERATSVGDEAAARDAAMLYPLFAWELSEKQRQHVNPSLPAELKLRVNRYRDYRQLHDPQTFIDELREDQYFNEHIRRRIRHGELDF